MRLDLSRLQKRKFNNTFQDLLNRICNCGLVIESSLECFLSCPTYNTERHTLLGTLKNVNNNLLDLTDPILTKTLLFLSDSFDINTNTSILDATIE